MLTIAATAIITALVTMIVVGLHFFRIVADRDNRILRHRKRIKALEWDLHCARQLIDRLRSGRNPVGGADDVARQDARMAAGSKDKANTTAEDDSK